MSELEQHDGWRARMSRRLADRRERRADRRARRKSRPDAEGAARQVEARMTGSGGFFSTKPPMRP